MKKFIVTLLLFVFFLNPVFAKKDRRIEKITPEIVLKAIGLIEQEPLGNDFKNALSIIVDFAEQSNDVVVMLDERILPWVGRENFTENEKAMQLLGVFVAGNIKNQIITGIPKDYSYEGLVLTIKTYTVWRKKDLIENIPELEEWSTFSNKELHALIDKEL